ncbi:hypothetical protein D3Z53_22405, partial [Lachnospiraceae bacterium]|nr:hypothetical protein [Lachnospiraceae bacterium]
CFSSQRDYCTDFWICKNARLFIAYKKAHNYIKMLLLRKTIEICLCKLISECYRKWVVTYDICPLVAELYKKYRSSYLDVIYSIQISKKAQEYIFLATIYNYQILSLTQRIKNAVKQRAKHFCIINLFAVIGSPFVAPVCPC